MVAGTKQGVLPIRIALAASISHGNDWFPVNDVCRSLFPKNAGNKWIAGTLAQRMVQIGIAETQLQGSGKGFRTHVARLTCDLVEQSHFHGKKSLQLRGSIEAFYCSRSFASPVAALLLVGLHVFQIHHSRELRRFLEPESSVVTNPSICGWTLRQLDAAGLLAIDRSHVNLQRPYLVYPL